MRMSDMTVCPVASRQSFFDSFTVTKAIEQFEKLLSGKVSVVLLLIDKNYTCTRTGCLVKACKHAVYNFYHACVYLI